MIPTLRAAVTAILLTAPSCSHPPLDGSGHEEAAKETRVDITYVLGHTQRRLLARSGADLPRVQLFLEKAVLEEGPVEQARFAAFVEKVVQFMSGGARSPADETCRSPYQVRLHRDGKTQAIQGCRAPEDGVLARLIRDGELLLFRRAKDAE